MKNPMDLRVVRYRGEKLNVITFRKGSESYVFTYTREVTAQVQLLLNDLAENPDLSFDRGDERAVAFGMLNIQKLTDR